LLYSYVKVLNRSQWDKVEITHESADSLAKTVPSFPLQAPDDGREFVDVEFVILPELGQVLMESKFAVDRGGSRPPGIAINQVGAPSALPSGVHPKELPARTPAVWDWAFQGPVPTSGCLDLVREHSRGASEGLRQLNPALEAGQNRVIVAKPRFHVGRIPEDSRQPFVGYDPVAALERAIFHELHNVQNP
jgi:hypothetical protein